jgi:hypothetical protein
MRGVTTIFRTVVLVALAVSLTGCAMLGGKDDSPAWYRQRVTELEKGRFPKLASVPETTPPSKTPAEWQRTETEVQNAGAALEANPRAASVGVDAAAAAGAFEAEARKEATPPRPER